MDIDSLLQRASSAPLGPLSLAHDASGQGEWTLKVTLGGRTVEVSAEGDPKTDGLVLTTRFPAGEGSPVPAGPLPWVTESLTGASGSEVRLWLHGDGLSPAMLLSAVAAMAQMSAPPPAAQANATVEQPALPLIPIEIPEPEPKPEPVPVSTHRAISWESFGFGAAAAPPTADTPPPATTPAPETDAAIEEITEPAALVGGGEVPADAATVVATSAPATAPAGAPPTPLDPSPTTADVTLPRPVGRAGYCRECGSPFAPDHVFCTNCGARLD